MLPSSLFAVQRSQLTDSVLPPGDIKPFKSVALEPADSRCSPKAQESLLPIRKLSLDVFAERQICIFLRTHKRSHEEEQDDRPLASLGAISPCCVPETAFEHESSAGWPFGRQRAVLLTVRSEGWLGDDFSGGFGTYHRKDVARRNIAQMRGRVHTSGAVLVCDVFQVEHDVHAISNITGRWRNGELVGVELHRDVAWSSDIGCIRVDDRVVSQVPRYDLVDQGVVQQVDELVAFVDDVPMYTRWSVIGRAA